ncbi:MAG: dipeptidase [Pirellulaceae bacterium]
MITPEYRPTRRRFLRTALAAAAAAAGTGRLRGAPGEVANETIQRARQAALAVLQPSDRDLERGLRIHAEAVVMESYGFAPRAAIDGAAFQRAIDRGASAAELTDLREEMSMTRMATDTAERAEFLEAFHAAGVTCIFENAGEEGNDPLRLLKRLARYTFTTDQLRDVMPKAVSPDDVVAAKQAGRLCLALTTNGVPLRQQWESISDELRYVRLFRQMGVRMMHLTYNRRNPLGDGCGEPQDGGLSDFGRAAIAEMNRLGVIVDVAHTGWRTSREAAQASTRPTVASHTACCGVHLHFRGKPDDVVRAICDTGGLIGICCIPRFLGGTGDLKAFLDHLDYAIQKFGPDHVAIGTDIAYVSRHDAMERKKITGTLPRASAEARWEHLWPRDDTQLRAGEPASLAWTNWPMFTVGLVQRGHSEETIRKILGENVLRVWRANEAS